jgi:queuine tRNA-ribosyltransferase
MGIRFFVVIDPGLPCESSQYYTKAYLRHLFVADELLGLQLASIQNLAFYLWLVGEARKHILAGDFKSWKGGDGGSGEAEAVAILIISN